MLLAAIALIVAGVLMIASAVFPMPFDFAVAVAPQWHVAVFPAPLWIGVLVFFCGLVTLLTALQWR